MVVFYFEKIKNFHFLETEMPLAVPERIAASEKPAAILQGGNMSGMSRGTESFNQSADSGDTSSLSNMH